MFFFHVLCFVYEYEKKEKISALKICFFFFSVIYEEIDYDIYSNDKFLFLVKVKNVFNGYKEQQEYPIYLK